MRPAGRHTNNTGAGGKASPVPLPAPISKGADPVLPPWCSAAYEAAIALLPPPLLLL